MKKASIIILLVLSVSVFLYVIKPDAIAKNSINWQSQVSPGKLSGAHAQLETNCASCHTAIKGVADEKCISCHANNRALLQRQPTSFHATIGNCASCHVEHQGFNANLTIMNHTALAKIGEKLISDNNSNDPTDGIVSANNALISSLESKLNCASCHSTKDKHLGLFGPDCASCHATTQWTISAFKHPSVNSIDCAQCHQAPPSHYMEHFDMISKRIAARPNDKGSGCCEGVIVSQCYSCHKTTSWNDIQGVGYYKHH
ncbi:hypothetical protein FC093_17155 [Ilyomonas limi]|uniref:Tetrahaem cytochrome domain-containing protein n=1 Tax=Ilyomonas limi TaxID=2575867 RepID=A0A4V5UTT1_9BACT|nr:cytochrome c3 family protein [Ilyomonas limi]TKK66313.1 hypothetical protein FC093_17155 [Ilyomonas limi]